MAEYDDVAGVKGAVENENYCMPSWNKRNVDDMNQKSGYNNMADLANTPKPPTMMKGATENRQLDPKMPGNDKYNYDKNR